MKYERSTDVLYQLTAIYYENKKYARYPRFKVWRHTDGYYHTLKDAEKRIGEIVEDNRKNIANGDDDNEHYGFEISEIPFGWELKGYSQRTCIYLEDGSFFSGTKVSSLVHPDPNIDCFEPFKGRAEEECHFKVGDLVEVLSGNIVSLEIVCDLPPTPERVEQIYHRTRENYQRRGVEIEDELCWRLDNTDDSYVTLDGDEGYMENHSHPSAIRLFPVRSKVPTKLQEKLERGLKKVQNE